MSKAQQKKFKHALMICNGDLLSRRQVAPLLRPKPFIVCADGGANGARKLRILPHVIIGDLDSITPGTRKYFSDVPVIRVSDQNSTDLEKALDYVLKSGIRRADVLGATGGRPDHSFANLSILKKYNKRISLQFLDPFCSIRIVEGKIEVPVSKGTIVSLMPLGRCEGITTKGLRYPLTNESLEIGIREGTSNVAVSSPVKISLKKGSLLLFIARRS